MASSKDSTQVRRLRSASNCTRRSSTSSIPDRKAAKAGSTAAMIMSTRSLMIASGSMLRRWSTSKFASAARAACTSSEVSSPAIALSSFTSVAAKASLSNSLFSLPT